LKKFVYVSVFKFVLALWYTLNVWNSLATVC
jgi:hypothetical protein